MKTRLKRGCRREIPGETRDNRLDVEPWALAVFEMRIVVDNDRAKRSATKQLMINQIAQTMRNQ